MHGPGCMHAVCCMRIGFFLQAPSEFNTSSVWASCKALLCAAMSAASSASAGAAIQRSLAWLLDLLAAPAFGPVAAFGLLLLTARCKAYQCAIWGGLGGLSQSTVLHTASSQHLLSPSSKLLLALCGFGGKALHVCFPSPLGYVSHA
jgi:hypothetical protein